jgi:trimethylamine--corrinoid protein Co-methyltransferase
MLVLQDEVIGYVESMMRELDFSDEAIGLDLIHEVGPGGTFIDQMHTVEHFRRELWFPKLLNRQYYEAWQEAGALSTEQQCIRCREELLSTHHVAPLERDMDKTLDQIVASAQKHLSA